MKTQKCCAHCPGKPVSRENNDFHECCQPTYVSGNLRIPSLKKHVPDIRPKRREIQKDYADVLSEERSTYEPFALAKKLHAENLKHQPLPDKVDDSIFKNVRASVGHCCKLSPGRYCESCGREVKSGTESLKKRYEPALGYKEPKTKMDLAICWETPVDSTYEPPRSTHIDGSDGGLGPAIFTFVQHSSTSRATLGSATKRNVKDSSPCSGEGKSLYYSRDCTRENKKEGKKGAKCCCDFLCKGLNGVNISKRTNNEGRPSSGYFRKCTACEARSAKKDPRLVRSAVGFALGTEKGGSNQRKTDTKVTIPRVKTPFARRSFCIDTLTAPFSVVNRRRDSDYPEHWRLMSVYQQSYRNPYKRQYRC